MKNEETPHHTQAHDEGLGSPTTGQAVAPSAHHVNSIGYICYAGAALLLALQVTKFIIWWRARHAA